jgi:hypothetical protein
MKIHEDAYPYDHGGNAEEKWPCPFTATAHINIRQLTQANAEQDIR